jgi:hypothetical protein
MKSNTNIKSPIDGIIIDLIMDHFNMQSMSGLKESLTGEEFNTISIIYIFPISSTPYSNTFIIHSFIRVI